MARMVDMKLSFELNNQKETSVVFFNRAPNAADCTDLDGITEIANADALPKAIHTIISIQTCRERKSLKLCGSWPRMVRFPMK
jgi:hypothetical protein